MVIFKIPFSVMPTLKNLVVINLDFQTFHRSILVNSSASNNWSNYACIRRMKSSIMH